MVVVVRFGYGGTRFHIFCDLARTNLGVVFGFRGFGFGFNFSDELLLFGGTGGVLLLLTNQVRRDLAPTPGETITRRKSDRIRDYAKAVNINASLEAIILCHAFAGASLAGGLDQRGIDHRAALLQLPELCQW